MPNATEVRTQRFSIALKSLLGGIVTLALLLQNSLALSQDQNDAPQSVLALEKIQRDYLEHLKKRDRIRDEFNTIEETFKQTQDDLQRISSDAVRNQLLALQSSLNSKQIVGALNDIPNQQNYLRTLPGGSSSRTRLELGRYQNRLVKQKANSDLSTAIKQEELRQLDAASQLIVKRRMECIQNGFNLQNEWALWQQEWQRFIDLYWPYMDPERTCNRSEIEARLTVLKQSSQEDYPAMLASATLLERLGRNAEGLEMVEQVLAAGTLLDSTALYIKSLILSNLKKDKEAKLAFQNAIKVDTKTPQNHWIRALNATSRGQWNSAETELKPLLEVKPYELDARRYLALIHSARAAKSPKEAAKSLKEATIAFDLEPKHDWFSYFVLSLAHYSNGSIKEALEQLDRAEEKALDEGLMTCQQLRQAIQAERPYAWNFVHGCLASASELP